MSKSIIGCDLNERYCQVSFYSEEHQEPQTLATIMYPTPNLYTKAICHESDEMVNLLREFIEKS